LHGFKLVEILDGPGVNGSFLNYFLQGVQEELGGVGLSSLILLKFLGQLSGDGQLLGLDEAIEEHLNGMVDVVCSHVLSQVHFGMGLRHSDHGLNVTHGYGDAADHIGLPPDVRVELGDFILVDLGQSWSDESLGVN
jgi:hypothetical protein